MNDETPFILAIIRNNCESYIIACIFVVSFPQQKNGRTIIPPCGCRRIPMKTHVRLSDNALYVCSHAPSFHVMETVMPSYNDQNRSRSSQHRSDGHPVRQASQQHSSRQAQRGERRPPRQGHPSNQRGQRSEQRPYRSARNARTMNGHDAGYTLHQRSINFNGSHGITNLDRGSLLLIAGALVILLLMIFAISSCVRSCSTPRNAGSTATSSDVNTQDARVAVGASADVIAGNGPTATALADLGHRRSLPDWKPCSEGHCITR